MEMIAGNLHPPVNPDKNFIFFMEVNMKTYHISKLFVLLICINLNAFIVYAERIPDTGQTESFTDVVGEDSDYLINPASYQKLDASGNALPVTSTEWCMVKDNITGLTWEKKTTDGSNQDKEKKYTWTNIESYLQSLNASGVFSDWRLPSISELATIVQLKTDLFYNSDYFPNTVPAYYWSSDKMSFSSIWVMNFDNASADTSFMSSSNNIRAVRGGKKEVANYFIVNGDGTVTDIRTGLMWQRNYETNMSWTNGLTHCENFGLAGFDDWRLPNREEIRSIVDYSLSNPAINTHFFPETMPMPFWTSSGYDNESSWSMFMDSGKAGVMQLSFPSHVRAVRGGQKLISNAIQILSPTQGSHWNAGDTIPVIWETGGINGNVGIAISYQGGKPETMTRMINSTENDGYYEWIATGGSVNCVLTIIPWEDESRQTKLGHFSINDIQSGIILHLPFDGDLFDDSDNRNHGENHGIAFSKDRMGQPNKSCLFEKIATAYIDIGKCFDDTNSLTSLSYAFWLKPNASDINNTQTLLNFKGNTNDLPQINIKLIEQKISYEVIDDQNNLSRTIGPVVLPDNWTFVSITVNDQVTKIFLNGQEKATFTGPGAPGLHSNDLSWISISSPQETFSGLMDDFKLYNRVLSDTEIEQLYQLKHFSVSSDYYFLTAKSGHIELTVYSNSFDTSGKMDFTLLSENYEWLTASVISGQAFEPTSTIHMTIAENTGAGRNAVLQLETSDHSPIQIEIVQENANIEIEQPENLQDIINAAADGSVIMMDDGNYQLNEIKVLDKQIHIQSKNGPENCIIHGAFVLENQAPNLSGLTLISDGSYPAIKIKSAHSLIYNCIIQQSKGEGIVSESSSVSIVNTLIVKNGGNGFQCTNSTVNIIHSTIADNTGMGIVAENSTINMNNSILWENQSSIFRIGGEVFVSHSTISGGFEGEGNINQDPLFVDPENDKYQLKDDSPCIDSGEMFSSMPFSDIASDSRPKPVGSMPDMGPIENKNGKKAVYVAFPPDAESFCAAPDAFMNIMWDASEAFQFYRFSLYKDIIHPDNNVIQDWCKRSHISIPYNLLEQDQQYVWSVEAFPASPEANMITGQFRILSDTVCSNQTDDQKILSISFLFGYLITKQDIKTIKITGGAEPMKSQVKTGSQDWFKYFGAFFNAKAGYQTRYVHFPGQKKFPIIIKPYWIRVIVYDDYLKRWKVWF